MVFYKFQGVVYRGSKFYYNPMFRIMDRYSQIETMHDIGFFHKTKFMEAAREYRPHNWFYDDARAIPKLIFGEDAILDHWNQRFSSKNAHAFSFISKHAKYYKHPRDIWIDTQVGLMKSHRVGYEKGYQLMEREHQKNIYTAELERQHQLQQVQELGGCSELGDVQWVDKLLQYEATTKSTHGREAQSRYFKKELQEMIDKHFEEFTKKMQLIAKHNQEIEDEEDYIEPPTFKKISLTDFHPAAVDQNAVKELLNENPDYIEVFDMTWLALDKEAMFELYTYDKDTFEEIMETIRLQDAKWERLNEIHVSYWEKFLKQKRKEQKDIGEELIIPEHPHQFPRKIFEEEVRDIRSKDKEFSELMAKAGHKDAEKWYLARKNKKDQALNTIQSIESKLDDIIQNKQSKIKQNEIELPKQTEEDKEDKLHILDYTYDVWEEGRYENESRGSDENESNDSDENESSDSDEINSNESENRVIESKEKNEN